MSYPYQKHTWVTKEIIRREYLQNIEDGIYDEQQHRLDAESGLQNNIDAEATTRSSADDTLQDNIDAEETRAIGVEQGLQDQIDSNDTDISSLDTRISNEYTRATTAEAALRTYVDDTFVKPTDYATTSTSGVVRVDGTSITANNGVISATDTKNTTGSSNTSSKIFLVGATSQATNPVTYSHDTAYVGTDGHVYSNSKQVVNLSDSQALTNKTINGYTPADAMAKGVDTSISSGSTSTNLPTSAAVASYVDSAIDDIVPGHTITNGTTTYTQRSKLKFTNCTITDDSTNDATIVSANGSAITVDSALSTTSTNPVQNAVITNALADKEDTLTFDTTPTSGSTNPVTSGGVKTALDAKANSATTLAGYGITNAYTKTETGNQITSAINALDVSDSAVNGSYVTTVSETNGKISVTRETADTTPTASSKKMVTSGGVKTALNTKANISTISESYNASTAYAVGDYFIYNDTLYKVKVACTGVTPPNTSYYTSTTVASEISNLANAEIVVAAPYNSAYISSSYLSTLRLGNIVIISGRFTVGTEKPAGQSNWLFRVPVPAGLIIPIYNDGSGLDLIVNQSGYITSNKAVPANTYDMFVAYARS